MRYYLTKTLALILLISLCTTNLLYGENSEIDSLEQRLMQVTEEEKIDILHRLSILYRKNDPVEAMERLTTLMELADKYDHKLAKAKAYFNKGKIFRSMSKYYDALKAYDSSLIILNEVGSVTEIANCFGNIGTVYRYLDDYDRALEYHLKSLAIYEKLNDSSGQSNAMNNIGNIHIKMGNNEIALEYMHKSIAFNDNPNKKKHGHCY